MEIKGYLHLYWGDGKGKTTAAAGLALRALGQRLPTVFLQFLKDGQSGELEPLRRLGAAVLSGEPGMKFVFQMTEAEKAKLKARQDRMLREAVSCLPAEGRALLVLDEACAALQTGTLSEPLLRETVLRRPQGWEVVLTGRDPTGWMREAADYSTEMRCAAHPFDRGVPARRGIEY